MHMRFVTDILENSTLSLKKKKKKKYRKYVSYTWITWYWASYQGKEKIDTLQKCVFLNFGANIHKTEI